MMEEHGVNLKKNYYTIGVTDAHIVMLDNDDMRLKECKEQARWLCDKFHLGGVLIQRSSEGHYNTTFDRYIPGYLENVQIMATWVIMNGIIKSPAKVNYFVMQCRKLESTLRSSIKITHRRTKPRPVTVCTFGSQSGMIKEYLARQKKAQVIEDTTEEDARK